MRIVCVEAEQKSAKQNNQIWLEGLLTIREYQNYLEEGKLIVGVQYQLFLASCKKSIVGGCRFFQIPLCILPSVELVEQVW